MDRQPSETPRPGTAKTHPARPLASRNASGEDALGSTRVIDAHAPESGEIHVPSATNDGDDEATPAPSFRPKKSLPMPPILGGYTVLRKLGEGAMGAVYLARHAEADREVALKVLFPHIAANPKLVERLYREGRVMGQLDHPNLIQAYAIGEDQGWHFVAMEFIEGKSLQAHIDQLGSVPVADAVHVTLACLRALEYAHKSGIVHRDIKPDNVLIDRRAGIVKVADLGMVKTDDEEMSLTQTGHAVGTPWYMPLEQARNAKEIDGRSDIYALGCMLYCMLVGHPPFTGRTIVEVIQAKEAGTFSPARKTNVDVSEKLDLVILKMTAKHPKHRYQSCAEVLNDLTELNLSSPSLSFLKKSKTPKLDTPVDGKATVRVASATSDTDVQAIDPEVWYLRVKAEGGDKAHKLTTAQVTKMIQEGTVGPGAKISRLPNQGFRAVASFKEFADVTVRQRGPKSVATDKYRDLYKKIEQKETKRDGDDEKVRDLENRKYWVGIFWRSLVGVLLFFALAYFVVWVIRGIAG
ncbi:MAG: serine/threonine protein kinase [Gemmataceae bacterium]|nr:serine/threonine protein kinase [Gemmataceae bacterium]